MKKHVVASVALAAFIAFTASCRSSEISQTTPAVTIPDITTLAEPVSAGTGSAPDSMSVLSGENDKAATGTRTGAFQTPPTIEEPVIYDQIYYNKEENVELAIMRVDNEYLTYSKDRTMAGWTYMESPPPEEVTLEDGEFGIITADITRVSGGVAGYSGEPRIDRLISYRPVTFEEIKEYAEFEAYDPSETYCHAPELFGDYCIVYTYPNFHIYLNGKPYGVYDNVLSAQSALGLNALEDDNTIEIEDYGSDMFTVMRVGDTYLSYFRSIFMNDYWTPIVDKYLQNNPTYFELADGEAVTVTGEYSSLNGGEAGYVNVPLIRKVREVKECDYDYIIFRTDSIPWYGEWERSGDGESVSEASTRVYLDQQEHTYAAFENNSCTWLIFWIDGKYRVYCDDHKGNRGLYGVYESTSEVDHIIG